MEQLDLTLAIAGWRRGARLDGIEPDIGGSPPVAAPRNPVDPQSAHPHGLEDERLAGRRIPARDLVAHRPPAVRCVHVGPGDAVLGHRQGQRTGETLRVASEEQLHASETDGLFEIDLETLLLVHVARPLRREVVVGQGGRGRRVRRDSGAHGGEGRLAIPGAFCVGSREQLDAGRLVARLGRVEGREEAQSLDGPGGGAGIDSDEIHVPREDTVVMGHPRGGNSLESRGRQAEVGHVRENARALPSMGLDPVEGAVARVGLRDVADVGDGVGAGPQRAEQSQRPHWLRPTKGGSLEAQSREEREGAESRHEETAPPCLGGREHEQHRHGEGEEESPVAPASQRHHGSGGDQDQTRRTEAVPEGLEIVRADLDEARSEARRAVVVAPLVGDPLPVGPRRQPCVGGRNHPEGEGREASQDRSAHPHSRASEA